MNDTTSEKSPAQTFAELRTMVTDYARQETVGPLQHLGKWVAWGLGGAVAVAIGVGYLGYGLLRLLQNEVDSFADTRWTWAPYLITFAFLVAWVGLMGWLMSRKFTDGD